MKTLVDGIGLKIYVSLYMYLCLSMSVCDAEENCLCFPCFPPS